MIPRPPTNLRKDPLMFPRMMRIRHAIIPIPTRLELKRSLVPPEPRPRLFTATIAWFQLDRIGFKVPSILFKAEGWIGHGTECLVSFVILELLSIGLFAIIDFHYCVFGTWS